MCPNRSKQFRPRHKQKNDNRIEWPSAIVELFLTDFGKSRGSLFRGRPENRGYAGRHRGISDDGISSVVARVNPAAVHHGCGRGAGSAAPTTSDVERERASKQLLHWPRTEARALADVIVTR